MQFFRALPRPQAMTFDLDDTLYNNEPVIAQANTALLTLLAQDYPLAHDTFISSWRQIQKSLLRANPALASDMSELRRLGLRTVLAAENLAPVALEQATNRCFEHFYTARSDFSVSPEICDVLDTLSRRIPLIGITNGNVNADAIGIAPYFTHIFHASLTRPMKPHRHMFDEASALLNLKPGQILHVGDNLEKDVLGAHKAGFHTAWFAMNRAMAFNQETVPILPSVKLSRFSDLLTLVE